MLSTVWLASTVASRAPIEPVKILKSILSVPALVPISRSHLRNRSTTACLCPKRASICQRAMNMSFSSVRDGLERNQADRAPVQETTHGGTQNLPFADRARNQAALFVPGLDDGLVRDLAALEFDHRQAEHLGPIRIGAGLREGQSVALGDAGIHLMGHRPTADIVPESADRRLALDLARLARRIVAVDDA